MLARNSDPVTSHAAADEIQASGKHQLQKTAVYQALRMHPNLTSAELANAAGLDRYLVARRLPDMEGESVEKVGKRKCMMTGRLAMTWRPI